jgi:hypothetical protein
MNKLNKSLKNKGISMKRRGKRPNPLNLTLKNQYKINNLSYETFRKNLKYMQITQINKLYNKIKEENIDFEFDCKILKQEHGRKMIKITSINKKPLSKNLFFYQSTGKSRNNKIKDIWFPCDEVCLSPISKRITKAENRYLYNNRNNLTSQIKKETPSYNPANNEPYLSKYGRFINKENTIISKMLYNGFKCKSK